MVDEKSATEVQQKIQPTRAQQTPPPLKVVKKVVKKPVAPMVTQAQPQLEAPAGPKGKVAKVRRAVDTRLEQKVTLLPHYTGFKIVQRKKDSTTLVQVQTADGKILLTQTTMPDVYTDPLTKTNYKIGESDSLTQVLKLCNRYNASQVRNKQTESLLKEIEDLEERVSALGEQNKSLELEIKTYSSFGTPEELASKLNEFEQYKREVTEKIAGLEKELERKKSFDELLGTSTVAKDKEIGGLKAELQEKASEIQNYGAKLQKRNEELEQLQKLVDTYKTEKEAEIQALQDEVVLLGLYVEAHNSALDGNAISTLEIYRSILEKDDTQIRAWKGVLAIAEELGLNGIEVYKEIISELESRHST